MKLRILLISILLLSSPSYAELVQQFKDPSFSGNGWSSHVLTIEQLEQSRKDSIAAAQQANAAAATAAAQNTPLAKFMSLFSSQVYAQLATQLTNTLFKDPCKNADGTVIVNCTAAATAGTFTLDGNTVSWVKLINQVQLTVVDGTGNQTVVAVPLASFAF